MPLKTTIIALEDHDDLVSVRDRLAWAKTPRIVLTWPKYARVPLTVLDLVVLQRHAGALGARLGLVTRLAAVRRAAIASAWSFVDRRGAAGGLGLRHPQARARDSATAS
jgi:hypothetical protein